VSLEPPPEPERPRFVEEPDDDDDPSSPFLSRPRQLGVDGVLGESVSRPRRLTLPLDELESEGCELGGGVVVGSRRPTAPVLEPRSIGATLPRPIGATLPRPIGATEDPPPPPLRVTPPETVVEPELDPEPPRERSTRSRTSPEMLPSRRKNGVMSATPTLPAPVSAPVRRPSSPRRCTASAGLFHSSRVKRGEP
jgi:hypothetical protein